MSKLSTPTFTRFTAVTAALFFASCALPFLAHAQSGSASDVIQLAVGEGKVTLRASSTTLHPSENSVCTTTSDGLAIAVAIGGECSSFSTSVDLPAPLYVKITADSITFRESDKTYEISDAATVNRARSLFAPIEGLVHQQRELGDQQRLLGKKQRDLGEQQHGVKVNVPDMSSDFAKVEADAKRLSTEGGTQSELGDLQSELGDLQSRLGDLQSQAGDAQSKLGDQQSVLGDQQSALGDKQSALGDRESELSGQVARQLKDMLDQSISSGSAKPE